MDDRTEPPNGDRELASVAKDSYLNPTTSSDGQIERYLRVVSAQLGAATLEQREKIAAEITAAVHSSVEHGENADTLLARLGPPEKLGERYREVLATLQASRSLSPIVLLMTSFRRGILGIAAGVIGLAGYWLGGIFLVFGALTLLWTVAHAGPNKTIPIGASLSNIFEIIGSGIFLLLLSTILLRTFLRVLHRRQLPI